MRRRDSRQCLSCVTEVTTGVALTLSGAIGCAFVLTSYAGGQKRPDRKMISISSKTVLLVILNLALMSNSEEVKSEGRDFHGYLPPEEGKHPEYQVFQYPSQGYPFKEDYLECGRNPMIPLLGKGLNLLLLKLGIFGIIKAVMALIFVAFLAKLPLIFLKVAFLKSLFFPLLIAPLFMHMFTNQMTQTTEGTSEQNKPGEVTPEMPGMSDMTMGMGRELNDNLTSVAWESMKMFVESDQCIEKISCMIGASSRDSSIGSAFTRMLKYLHHSSPPSLRERMTLIRDAFSKGSRTSACLPEDFKCESPELMLQYGLKQIKVL